MPKFSIVIPLYNKEKDILKTLESVIKQSFKDYEIIIINDGSTDNSLEIAGSLKLDSIKLFDKKNEGVALTRNFGVEKANSENIVFLDADDYWYPYHLENMDAILKKFPDAKWFATAYEKKYISGKKNAMGSSILIDKPQEILNISNYFEYSLVDALAWTSAVGMKKSFFKYLNGFDHTITNGAGEDTDLWLRAALVEPLAYSTKVSATHNLDGSNRISHTPTKNRIFMNLDKYEEDAKKNIFLKKYLDLNRYSFAIKHKIAGDIDSYNRYVEKLDVKNLNSKQKYLLRLPAKVLKLLTKVKFWLESKGINLTSF